VFSTVRLVVLVQNLVALSTRSGTLVFDGGIVIAIEVSLLKEQILSVEEALLMCDVQLDCPRNVRR
jgi:hypothetical protein